MRRKQYRTSDEVFLSLLQGLKERSIKSLIYKYKSTDEAYHKLLLEGLDKYEDYCETEQVSKYFVDPEKEMGTTAFEDFVGHKD